jgi:hypothetical protein
MDQDPNHTQTSGKCIPIAWSPLDPYRVRGNRTPKMPTPCPCGSSDCRKKYDDIKAQVEEIIKVFAKNK